jgi:hypothetical protein
VHVQPSLAERALGIFLLSPQEKAMKYFVMVVGVLVGAAATVGIGALVWWLQVYQPTLPARVDAAPASAPAGVKVNQHVYLSLDTFPQSPDSTPQWEQEHNYQLMRSGAPVINPHLDWVTYGPSNTLQVPAYSEVTITIKQYDSGGTLLNGFYSQVRGVTSTAGGPIDNTMLVDGKSVGSVAPDNVAHTFTIHGTDPSGQPYLFVSVPLPLLPDADVSAGKDNGLPADPHVVQFTFYVQGPGHYVWQCEYPCGTGYNGFGGPMSGNGYMNGTFDVVG